MVFERRVSIIRDDHTARIHGTQNVLLQSSSLKHECDIVKKIHMSLLS